MDQILTTRFMTHSLRAAPWGQRAARIMAAAIQAVEPGAAVAQYIRLENERLIISEQIYNLNKYQRIFLIGAGKAGAPMAGTAAEILGPRLNASIIIVKEGHTDSDILHDADYGKTINAHAPKHTRMLRILEACHPLPDQRGVTAAQQIEELLASTQPDDLVICLISGGGSALLVSPSPGITLDHMQELTASLLTCGANINEINTLRKHLDRVKGGGLAGMAAPAAVATLILSDVVGDPLDVIASGPTVPDPSTYEQAYQILEKYDLLDRVPRSITTRLEEGQRGELPETPKPGDPVFERVQNVIIGSNIQAARAAVSQAQKEGLHTLLLTTWLQGEARQAGRFLAAIGRQINAYNQPVVRPACVVAGGETTVTIKGNGLGGRNQEMALGALSELAGLPDSALITLATDGGDGPTDAAGAVVTGETRYLAHQMGLNPDDFLVRNDAYNFFEPLGDLLKPGPTYTNVNDLAFLFAW
ncbi:glycerate kinase [Chloroflexota bacterium]